MKRPTASVRACTAVDSPDSVVIYKKNAHRLRLLLLLLGEGLWELLLLLLLLVEAPEPLSGRGLRSLRPSSAAGVGTFLTGALSCALPFACAKAGAADPALIAAGVASWSEGGALPELGPTDTGLAAPALPLGSGSCFDAEAISAPGGSHGVRFAAGALSAGCGSFFESRLVPALGLSHGGTLLGPVALLLGTAGSARSGGWVSCCADATASDCSAAGFRLEVGWVRRFSPATKEGLLLTALSEFLQSNIAGMNAHDGQGQLLGCRCSPLCGWS